MHLLLLLAGLLAAEAASVPEGTEEASVEDAAHIDQDALPPEQEPSAPPAPAPPTPAWTQHVKLRGYVDTYFSFDTAIPEDHRRPGFLYSYARTSGMTVNLALLGAEVDTPDVRGAALVMAGTFTEDNQGFEEPGLRNLYEARVGVRLAGRTWLDAGVFPSHLGAESAIGITNPTLTRSITAENSPYYLAGAKLSTAVGDSLKLGVVGANGWQSIRQSSPPSGGAGTWVTWTPSSPLTLNWSTWAGLQQPQGELRFFNDLTMTVSLDRLDLIAWVDVGTQGGDVWGGGNVQARGWLTQAVALCGRVENFTDPQGVIVQLEDAGTTLWGGSVGLDLALRPIREVGHGEAIWRIEARSLHSGRGTFAGSPWNHAVTTSLALGF